LQCADLLPESDDLLLDYVPSRPSEQDEDSIMRAVPSDQEGLIALFRLVARKRCHCDRSSLPHHPLTRRHERDLSVSVTRKDGSVEVAVFHESAAAL